MEAIMNISEVCYRLGVRYAVLSPGSRSAPLTISFARHEGIKCISVPDERSAGFIGMGLSLRNQQPVVLVCTSGSAMANYFPAVIEAFHQKIPLIVLSADRPLEWIGQGDGQCIQQPKLFGDFVKKSFEVLPDYENKESTWLLHRTISDAINLAMSSSRGPVHVNVPFREPFYPSPTDKPNSNCKVIEKIHPVMNLPGEQILAINKAIKRFDKILIVVGQTSGYQLLGNQINLPQLPVVIECTSNLFEDKHIVRNHDTFLIQKNWGNIQHLVPDLVITIGEQFISKSLKLFLRKHNENMEHWHVGKHSSVSDVFQCLTKTIQVESEYFFHLLSYEPLDTDYVADWLFEEMKAKIYINKYCRNQEFSELAAVNQLMDVLPKESVLFVGNSMPVRYVNLLRPNSEKRIEVYANRGASGIDGTSSTAVGIALANPEVLVTLLVGDVAFLYDKNAFWVDELPSNLRVVLLNNAGGGIFNMINGPKKQPELNQYFMTEHDRTAQQVCEESTVEYIKAVDFKSLSKGLANLYNLNEGIRLLEVFTSKEFNTKHFNEFKELKGYGEEI